MCVSLDFGGRRVVFAERKERSRKQHALDFEPRYAVAYSVQSGRISALLV